jgi:UDP-N-acetylmuramoyl-L-alanyl-D-glutamate--2,6-diaminopimelate ligase
MIFKQTIRKLTPPFLLQAYHFCWAFLGAVFFGFSGMDKNIKIIGVTGTSGKSTTCDFLTSIFQEAGENVASVSSIRFKVGEKEWENKYKMTMPGRFVIQRFLKQAKNAGCKYVVLEVTSEGIRQFRHKFINFDTVVFTNLTPEHIESHGGFENYKNEKLKLFKACKNVHVINADDKNAKDFLALPANKIISFGIEDAKDIDFDSSLITGFNIMNALAAISVAKVYGIDLETCKSALEKVKVIPGRMEVIAESPIKVVVDYAHTPEQLEAAYKIFKDKKLICVLGSCGGGRDKWKRPVLGEIAGKYCKEIIVTNEDPYDEDPMEIINAVAKTAGNRVKKVLDRKMAINKAIKMANAGDVVIITGKGSEPWMCVKNGKKIPWSDKAIAKDALKLINK